MDNLFQPILENHKVRIEPLTWQHFEVLLPIVLKYPDLGVYSSSTFEDEPTFRTYMEAAFDAKDKQIRYPFTILDKATGQYVGSTSYGNPSPKNKRVEIGWTWLSKDFQRSGINRNCKALLLQYAFEKLDFERVELKADARNEQSRKAMEGIGATYEGELRSHTVMADGFRRGTVYYSILKHEWAGIKSSIFAKIVS